MNGSARPFTRFRYDNGVVAAVLPAVLSPRAHLGCIPGTSRLPGVAPAEGIGVSKEPLMVAGMATFSVRRAIECGSSWPRAGWPLRADDCHYRTRGSLADPERPVTKLDREPPIRPLADARCRWKSQTSSLQPPVRLQSVRGAATREPQRAI